MTSIINTGGSTLIDIDGSSSLIDIAALLSVSGSGSFIELSDGGSAEFASGSCTGINGSASNLVISVPTLPTGLPLDLSGGTDRNTTFNVAQGSLVNIIDGTFTGTTVINVAMGATVDLTGGNSVTYSGTLTGSGAGTVQFSNGTLNAGLGGISFNFAGNLFQWTGGAFVTIEGNVTNLGTVNLGGAGGKIRLRRRHAGQLRHDDPDRIGQP